MYEYQTVLLPGLYETLKEAIKDTTSLFELRRIDKDHPVWRTITGKNVKRFYSSIAQQIKKLEALVQHPREESSVSNLENHT